MMQVERRVMELWETKALKEVLLIYEEGMDENLDKPLAKASTSNLE